MREKTRLLSEELKAYNKVIFGFDRENRESDFRPAHYPPEEEGFYLTIRCGLPGIYTTVNQWKDGKWQMEVLDGSVTIAYSRERIQLRNI